LTIKLTPNIISSRVSLALLLVLFLSCPSDIQLSKIARLPLHSS